jgi:transposase
LVAVAHSILVILYYLLKRPAVAFRELGPLYLEQLDEKHVVQHLVRRLERLGHKVTLEKRDRTEPVAAIGARSP